ncbi:ATP-dependent helicase [Marinomonas piezotolerans]|uniref:ATP-dependent helicase n=1 Tax=Marinomonas piezotolerans TaxID=2213058 RepID=A0A370UD33_9GAMM|nr:DEAD/DEAH box helicase [Marinomonas piezotolerans]RDL45707.1 ATP-dependent helicase [Marinomonas piezotolerans]
MYQLRDYQQEAVDATLKHFRQSNDSAVIVLPTGAGKSLVIAELCRLAKHKVICLAHVKELVEQNHQKLSALGVDGGIYAAGLKKKQLQHDVTFASIQSLARALDRISDPLSLLIIDECHRIPKTEQGQYHTVIKHFLEMNPNLKILGLTATPYRLDSGWIYHQHYWGFFRDVESPFFKKCIYELPLRRLVKSGYLTEPNVFNAAVAHYNFDKVLQPPTENDNRDVEQQLNELVKLHPRVTKAICEQIIELSQDRQGVMIFASTVEHAMEIISYLPKANSQIVTGETGGAERDQIIKGFKARQLKYLVNVSVLTTGFDAPHVDVIALLRPTESVSLFQQMVGRGLRQSPNKQDCLILDYTNSGYDIFQPEIGSKKPSSKSQLVQVECPQCEHQNIFWGVKAADGTLLEHYGRRCQGLVETLDGEYQCDYRFVFKRCPYCDEENDIAARHCQHCHKRLIDPDEILKKALNLTGCKVLRCQAVSGRIESNSIIITYHDEDGDEVKQRFNLSYPKQRAQFNKEFARRIAQGTQKLTFSSAQEIRPFIPYLVAPDFVIAEQDKQSHWKVTQLIFDYQGPYRKANQLN